MSVDNVIEFLPETNVMQTIVIPTKRVCQCVKNVTNAKHVESDIEKQEKKKKQKQHKNRQKG